MISQFVMIYLPPLPPEFFRSERFDDVFKIDLLGFAEKQATWRVGVEKFALNAN